jgi:hypothetical protein
LSFAPRHSGEQKGDREEYTFPAGTLLSKAATSVNGLKAEPVWRRPCQTRSSSSRSKFLPESSIRIAPVVASTEAIAMSGAFLPGAISEGFAATARSAARTHEGSRVV